MCPKEQRAHVKFACQVQLYLVLLLRTPWSIIMSLLRRLIQIFCWGEAHAFMLLCCVRPMALRSREMRVGLKLPPHSDCSRCVAVVVCTKKSNTACSQLPTNNVKHCSLPEPDQGLMSRLWPCHRHAQGKGHSPPVTTQSLAVDSTLKA